MCILHRKAQIAFDHSTVILISQIFLKLMPSKYDLETEADYVGLLFATRVSKVDVVGCVCNVKKLFGWFL